MVDISKAGIVAVERAPTNPTLSKMGVAVVMRPQIVSISALGVVAVERPPSQPTLSKFGVAVVMRPLPVSSGRRKMSLM